MMFNGDRAYNDLKKLAVDIGPRPSGTEAEKRAAEWIASEFEAMGLETRIDEFETSTGKVISKKLTIMEPYEEEVNCEVMPLSGSTGPEGITGELTYIETCDEEYLTPSITGKMVLTSGFPKDRKKSYQIMSKFKPLGIILIESTPRVLAKNLWGNVLVKRRFGEFPALRISFEDGLKIIKSGATKVHITAETEEMSVKSQNIIGEIKGTERPDEIVLIGGHYDTVLKVAGAGDNAGGTAITLELARVFKEKGTKRTMRFIAWGSEELGLLGSRDYATKLRETSEKAKEEDEEAQTEMDSILLCINLDVQGGLIGTNSSRILGPPELTASVKILSKELGTVFKVNEGVYSSDGTSLSGVGVPSISFSRNTPTNVMMHSIEDDMEWMNPKALQTQGEFVEYFLTRYVANAAAFPFERDIPEKQKKEIEDYFKRSLRKLP
jgi:hypothetical protein